MVMNTLGKYAAIAWMSWMGRRLLYSIVSCLLKHLTRKIKLKTLLDVSMYHTSLSGVRNVKFQTLLLGKCILTVTIRLTSKSVPPPQGHPTSVFCELSVQRSKYCPPQKIP